MIPKFRAWDKKSKMMYEVKSLIFTLNMLQGVNRNAIYPEKTLSLDDESTILMQSTGLFDKNGVEIFEGDVVRRTACPYHVLPFERKLEIVVRQKASLMLGEKVRAGYACIDFGNPFARSELLEVIGNIYEHPDLLEVSDDKN